MNIKPSPREWIETTARKYNNDRQVIYSMYDDFLEDTGSSCEKDTFKRRVREYTISDCTVPETVILEDTERKDLLNTYTEKYLLSLIEGEIKTKQKILNINDLHDLADKQEIPFDAFPTCIKNIREKIRFIYDCNLFNIKGDISDRRLKQKLKVSENELKYYRESKIDYENILESLRGLLKVYTPYKRPKFKKDIRADREANVLISDVHFDEWVDIKETMGMNEYNPDIAKKRIDKLFQATISNSIELKTDVLNIRFLGDIVSGIIHPELLLNSRLGVVQSVIMLVDYFAKWIRECTKYFRIIKCVAVVGNHGRMFTKPNFKKKAELNFDFFLYDSLRREVKDCVESFELPTSPYAFSKVFEYGILDMHGDGIKGGGGMSSVPSGINKTISLIGDMFKQNGQEFDIVNLGHFHTSGITSSFDGTQIVMNGSLIGAGEYGMYGVNKAEPPSQTYYIIEEGKGKRFIDNINLS